MGQQQRDDMRRQHLMPSTGHGSPKRAPTLARATALAFGALLVCGAGASAQAGVVDLGCRSGEALQRAVKQASTAGATEIRLAARCVYEVRDPATADDAFEPITGLVTIVGGEGTVVARDPGAPADFRLFTVDASGALTLRGLTLLGGRTGGTGGAIRSSGTLVLDRVTLTDHTASSGGAVWVGAGASATIRDAAFVLNGATELDGGALLVLGSVTLARTSFTRNDTPRDGGAIAVRPSGSARIVDGTFEYNAAGASGGAIATRGTLATRRSRIRFNSATVGGGIASRGPTTVLHHDQVIANDPDDCWSSGAVAGCTQE